MNFVSISNHISFDKTNMKWKLESGDFQYVIGFDQKGFHAFGNHHDSSGDGEFSILSNGRVFNGLGHAQYENHSFVTGKKGEETLTVSIVYPSENIRVKVQYVVYGNSGIMGRKQQIMNLGQKSFVIQGMTSMNLSLESSHYRLHTLRGGWAKEFDHHTEILEQGTRVLENRTGRSSNGMSPWFGLEDLKNGRTLVGQFAWSGNWKFAFTSQPSSTCIEIGIHDWCFAHDLHQGTSIMTPLAVFGMVTGPLEEASNRLIKFQKAYIIPEVQGAETMPVQFNTWYNGMGYVPLDLMKEFVEVAADTGCEVFVLDGGWENHELHLLKLGDWHDDPYWYPNGLIELSDYVHSKNMKFGLWVEIEIAGIYSKLFEHRPEWIQKRNGTYNTHEPTYSRMPLCLAHPEVKDWVFSELCRLVESYRVDWLKMDFNADLGAGCNDTSHGHQEGDGLFQYYIAFYDILERLIEKYPKLFIENCASGAMRFDLGLLQRSHTTWLSDEIKSGPSLHFIHGAIRAFHPSVCNHWAVEIPDFASTSAANYAFQIPMTGHFGIGANVKSWDENVRESAKTNVKTYKAIRELIAKGSVYHLTDQLPWSGFTTWGGDGWMSLQYVSEDKRESVVFVFHTKLAKMKRLLIPKGLLPDQTYQINYVNSGESGVRSGEELLRDGFNFSLGTYGDYSEIIRLKVVQ